MQTYKISVKKGQANDNNLILCLDILADLGAERLGNLFIDWGEENASE